MPQNNAFNKNNLECLKKVGFKFDSNFMYWFEFNESSTPILYNYLSFLGNSVCIEIK